MAGVVSHAQVETLDSALADAAEQEQEHLRQQPRSLWSPQEPQEPTKRKEAAAREVSILNVNEKYQQLQQDEADWKKAEEENLEKLMEYSPPPHSLQKNPPNVTPLYTHEMACIAVMGKVGTGKTTLINWFAAPGKKVRAGGLCSTTTKTPEPVFWKTSDGRKCALFERPGAGLEALGQLATGESGDATANFIAAQGKQGLKWWTAIILNMDRGTPQEALIYSMCKTLKVPILVARNKAQETLDKHKRDCEECGAEYDETEALQQIDHYITTILKVDKNDWLLMDARHPEKFQWAELVAYIEEHSRKLRRTTVRRLLQTKLDPDALIGVTSFFR